MHKNTGCVSVPKDALSLTLKTALSFLTLLIVEKVHYVIAQHLVLLSVKVH